MKQKFEKVLELTPITHPMGDERAKEIAKNWTHKGLDLLINLWHTYYTNTHHLLINDILCKFKEKQLNLEYIEPCLINIKPITEIEK